MITLDVQEMIEVVLANQPEPSGAGLPPTWVGVLLKSHSHFDLAGTSTMKMVNGRRGDLEAGEHWLMPKL